MNARRFRFLCAVIAAAVLFSACSVQPQETQPTLPNESTAATTEPTTIPTTVPTTQAPTEPQMPQWLREPVYPSYEDLFSIDRKYEVNIETYSEYGTYDPCSWFVTDGETGLKYTLNMSSVTGANKLYIYCEATKLAEFVWEKQEQRVKTLLGSDGRYAYVMDAEYSAEGPAQILRVDMLDGTDQVVAEADYFPEAHLSCGAVLYYAAYEKDSKLVSIHRIYLPEQKDELLVETDAPVAEFLLQIPKSTLGDIYWMAISEEMQQLVELELSNPESPFKSWRTEILWEEEQPLLTIAGEEAHDALTTGLSIHTDVRVMDTYQYCLQTDTVTEKKANWVPMLAGYDPSACILSDWEPLPDVDIQKNLTGTIPVQLPVPVLEGDGFYPAKLYFTDQGAVTAIVDGAFLQVQAYADAVYCITEDNKVLQIDYEGNICNTLYVSECDTLELWGYYNGHLYIREDSRILDLDLTELKYRTLLSFGEAIFVYNYYNTQVEQEPVLWVHIHEKDAVYVHTFDITKEAFTDARAWSSYGDTVTYAE